MKKNTRTCRECNFTSDDLTLFKSNVSSKDGVENMCKSCHSLESKGRYNRLRKERIDIISEYIGGLACKDCGIEQDFPFFDFHHIDPSTKYKTVGQLIPGSLDKLLKEIDKCIMLCPNCHRLRHM